MASTYSTRGRVELMATGEKSGTWGDINNTSIQLLETMIDGYVSITMADSNDTMTTANGSDDEARNKVIELTGTLSANREMYAPAVEKVYIVKNSTSGGFDVDFGVSGNTLVTVPNGEIVFLFIDGTDAYQIIPRVTSATSSLAGLVELATSAEVTTGTDTARAVTPEAIASSHVCRIKTGEYTGDGSTSQQITGVGFQPKYVRIWRKRTSDGDSVTTHETTDNMIDNNGSGLSVRYTNLGVATSQINQIISLDSDGFSIDDAGADESPNANGVDYEYLCLG